MLEEAIMSCTRWIGILALAFAPVAEAQLSADWMLAAAAHTPGAAGTFWYSDLSLQNPHEYDLPVVIQLLPSDSVNWEVPTIGLTLYPWETYNLWDALGPEWFDHGGTAAVLVYADTSLACDPITDCEFLVTSRTYTLDPGGSNGEFGQTIPGADIWTAVDWSTFGYAAGILNDGVAFRCNVGVASWTADWTTVQVDVQDAAGNILESFVLDVPPFGQVQNRLATQVTGGTLVFYLVEGPEDARVFPYASVVDQLTGDPSYQRAVSSVVGVSATKGSGEPARRPMRPGVSISIEAPDRPARTGENG
jgi:hypothetical protein